MRQQAVIVIDKDETAMPVGAESASEGFGIVLRDLFVCEDGC